MFRTLKTSTLPPDHVFACTVGPSSKQTLASYHVPDPADVISAIEALNKASLGAGGKIAAVASASAASAAVDGDSGVVAREAMG